MTLGEKIRVLRQRADLSQTQLAEALMVSRAAVAKWENENGMPDIGNLKALADYFRCDLESLLDETKELPTKNADRTIAATPGNYCDKHCDECPQMESGQCPGCDRLCAMRGKCVIADCCREHGYPTCAACGRYPGCHSLNKRDAMPQIRQEKQERERQEMETRCRYVANMDGYAWALFWLAVANAANSLLFGGEKLDRFPVANTIFLVVNVLVLLAHGVILLRMGKLDSNFIKAGLFMIAYGLCSGLSQLYKGADASNLIVGLLAVGAVILDFCRAFYECSAFSDAMEVFDSNLAARWKTAMKLYILSQIAILFGLMLGTIAAGLALIVMVISFVAVCCALGFIFYCRYQTAKNVS